MPTTFKAYRNLTQKGTHHELSKASAPDNQETITACKVDKKIFFDDKNKGMTKHKNMKQSTQFFCEHCNICGHFLSKSWKVHGYPLNFKINTWREEESTSSNVNAITNEATMQGEKMIDTKLT